MTVTDRVIELIRSSRDLHFIALGVLVVIGTPASLQDFGLNRPGALLWAGAVLLGALGALYAAMTDRLLLEVWSCVAVLGGMAMWAIGLVWRDDATLDAWKVALVVIIAMHGELVRIADTVGERRATR